MKSTQVDGPPRSIGIEVGTKVGARECCQRCLDICIRLSREFQRAPWDWNTLECGSSDGGDRQTLFGRSLTYRTGRPFPNESYENMRRVGCLVRGIVDNLFQREDPPRSARTSGRSQVVPTPS